MAETSEKKMFELLTEEKLSKTFEEVAKEIHLEKGKFVRFTPEYHATVNDMCCFEFKTRESISLATGLKWKGPFLEDFFMNALKQNISIGIVDEETGDIMATRLVKWEKLGADMPDPSDIEDEALRKVLHFVTYCEEKTKFAEHFHTDEAFHFHGLVVPERYTRQGLATKVMEFSLNFLKRLNLGKVVLKGETTSPYSRKIYEKMGFKSLFEIDYEDYKVNGVQELKTIDEPKVLNIYGKRLN